MHEIVTAKVGHTGSNKWRSPGESYSVETTYAVILAALGKVTRKQPDRKAKFPEVGGKSTGDANDGVSELKARYEAKFGKKPHHKMSVESISAALSAED